jgi:hypothetical protein
MRYWRGKKPPLWVKVLGLVVLTLVTLLVLLPFYGPLLFEDSAQR